VGDPGADGADGDDSTFAVPGVAADVTELLSVPTAVAAGVVALVHPATAMSSPAAMIGAAKARLNLGINAPPFPQFPRVSELVAI
jgi:hypothetical protein